MKISLNTKRITDARFKVEGDQFTFTANIQAPETQRTDHGDGHEKRDRKKKDSRRTHTRRRKDSRRRHDSRCTHTREEQEPSSSSSSNNNLLPINNEPAPEPLSIELRPKNRVMNEELPQE